MTLPDFELQPFVVPLLLELDKGIAAGILTLATVDELFGGHHGRTP